MKPKPKPKPNSKPQFKSRPHAPKPSAPGDDSIAEVRLPPAESAAPLVRQRDQLGPRGHESIPLVRLKTRSLHPLIYRKRVDAAEGVRAGDLAAVYAAGDSQPFAYGICNPRSELFLRLLWQGPQLPDDAAWKHKLTTAVDLRRQLLNLDATGTARRLIHAESDGFSGLVVDEFAGVLSAEAFSLGMYQRGTKLLEMLSEITNTSHWILRPSPQFLSQEGAEAPVLMSQGCPDNVIVHEYGTRFRVRFAGAHKTGFFCDQRENRRRLADFCQGRSVLDLCCYTGGFAVQAKTLGKAEEVTGVDLDEEPLKVARENANLNQARVRFVQADIFSYMRELLKIGRQYDVVILDPPKLIRSRMEIEEGTKKHFAMNRLAMRLVRPGGLLLSCSCAGLLPEPEFIQLLASAARSTGEDLDAFPGAATPRSFRILARTGAAPDHPVWSNCLETDYLKAVWMVIE